MTYSVKEIYYTLQGEGAHTGRPAVFLRFAGCNLWSGHARDRHKGPGGCSRWCDTDFVGTDGPGGGKFSTPETLVAAARRCWPRKADGAQPFVVCTGGEPLLQLDEPLLRAFTAAGWSVAVETNGTLDPPPGPLWLTVSPKAAAPLRLTRGNELKLVYPQEGMAPERFEQLPFEHFFLQPLDGPEVGQNTRRALEYCLAHPRWRLSLQTHKLLEIP
jgi:7-carboxy-7-deazaguanine synthase (Cx14CxxC type)